MGIPWILEWTWSSSGMGMGIIATAKWEGMKEVTVRSLQYTVELQMCSELRYRNPDAACVIGVVF